MRKLLFTLFVIVVCFNMAKAQTNVYQPWPSDSSFWLLEYYPNIYNNNPTEYYTATVWLGDTVINTKTYTKVYTCNGFPGFTLSSYTYTGGVRQDIPNEKLYQIGTSGSEYEVFNNQHLAIGDTFPCFTGNGILTNIDSVLIQGKYHKQYTDSFNTGAGISKQYIVGVGPVLDESDSYYYAIACYLLDTNSNFFPCRIPATTGIQTFSKQNAEFNIFPNPNNGSFVIEPNNATKQTMQVYDINGKMVLSQTINGRTNIDASSLNEGVYNISLLSSKGILNKRLVIVR